MKRRTASGASLVVDGAGSLERLRHPATRSTFRHITLGGPLADAALERRLNAAYFACGCQTGSIAVLVAISSSLLGGTTHGFEGRFSWWSILIYLAGAAMLGKLTGLAAARLQLRSILRSLARRVEGNRAETPDVP